MTKTELLQAVTDFVRQHLVTKEEVVEAVDRGIRGVQESFSKRPDPATRQRLSVAGILYYVGGAIVFMGIAIFVGQHWGELPVPTRLLTTLGSGIAAYVVGVLLYQYERLETMGQAFFLISAMVLPIGISVAFDEAGLKIDSHAVQSLIAGNSRNIGSSLLV